MPRVAIIDIGSNSIKLLVAARSATGGIETIATQGIDARISAGISHHQPRLAEEGMARGLAAIIRLLETAAQHLPARSLLVATSAVRDALNGREFTQRVLTATGHEVRILTGEEEAQLIGRGLTTDRELAPLRDFYVFDLGGGSLECLAFRERSMVRAVSFPLGCVRMTERFVADPNTAIASEALAAIARHTQTTLRTGFAFDLPGGAAAVATGGTIVTLRQIFARHADQFVAQPHAPVDLAQARALLTKLASLPLTARREFPGLSAARADVFPAAMATLLAVADLGGLTQFHHTHHTLRHGLADTLLAGTGR